MVKKPLSPQLGPAVRLLRMTGSGRWYSTRLERPLSGSCAAKRRAACNGIFAGATDRAASAKVRFVPHTDVLADKMLRHARMAAMRKLHRSVVWNGQSPVRAVRNRLDFLLMRNAAGQHLVKRSPRKTCGQNRSFLQSDWVSATSVFQITV